MQRSMLRNSSARGVSSKEKPYGSFGFLILIVVPLWRYVLKAGHYLCGSTVPDCHLAPQLSIHSLCNPRLQPPQRTHKKDYNWVVMMMQNSETPYGPYSNHSNQRGTGSPRLNRRGVSWGLAVEIILSTSRPIWCCDYASHQYLVECVMFK